MYFHPSGQEMTARKSPDCQRQGGRKARLDDTPNPGELPLSIVNCNEPKALTGSAPKTVNSQAARFQCAGARTKGLSVQRQGLNHHGCSAEHGKPDTSPHRGRHAARGADEVPGRGTLEKAKAIL